MMIIDDPDKPEFVSLYSYQNFARRVRHKRRYILTQDERAFLATVLATNRNRDVELPDGMILHRAQLGVDWQSSTDEEGNDFGEEPTGYGPSRMKPMLYKATEGRANPAGIAMLYLGTTEQTAISEVRPWIGAHVSVAQFKLARPLKAIDLSKGHGSPSASAIGLMHKLNGTKASADEKEKGVWIDIDDAFSHPVTISDDPAGYVPTQMLAELFMDSGYEALVYKSQFGETGFNIVLFNIDDAVSVNCAPFEVTNIDVKFKKFGNIWFAKPHYEEKK
jgi:RES domain